MKKNNILLLLFFVISTTSAQEHMETNVVKAAKEAISRDMKDPNSAQFRDIKQYKNGSFDVVCGEVNAKNSYGAYTGFRPFVVIDKAPFLKNADNAEKFIPVQNMFCQNK